MKKTLVAIAALTLVGAASAQVTITGGVRAAFQNDGKAAVAGTSAGKTIAGANDVASNNITIRATEDLGGGMTASARFVMRNDLMTGVPAPGGGVDATTQLWRNSDASLAGPFGSVRAGRFGLDGFYGMDPFGALDNMYTFTNVNGGRYNSMVEYTTPDISGFKATIGASAEGKANEEASWLYLNYNAGPISARLVSEKNQATTALQTNAVGIGGTYDLAGVAKFYAAMATKKFVVGGATVSDQFNIGASKSFGAITGKIGYLRDNAAPTAVNTFGENSITAIGADYALSKTTNLFLDVAKNTLNPTANWQLGFMKGF